MAQKNRLWSSILIALIFCVELTFAQTTGKIAGKVIDKATGEPLAGANVMLPRTSFGAAADPDGNFLEKEVVQDLEVIKGTFDAEYGHAMSDMVNAMTKESGNTWHANLSSGYLD